MGNYEIKNNKKSTYERKNIPMEKNIEDILIQKKNTMFKKIQDLI